jgi:hypothetical protein
MQEREDELYNVHTVGGQEARIGGGEINFVLMYVAVIYMARARSIMRAIGRGGP